MYSNFYNSESCVQYTAQINAKVIEPSYYVNVKGQENLPICYSVQ